VRARGDKTVFPRGPWAEPRVEWREVKGGLGCFSAPKQLTKEGKARRLTYCYGRTGCLITTSIPVCPASLK